MASRTLHQGSDASFLYTVKWKRAIQAGLLVGATLFLLSRGIPWVGSGAVNPAVMGRQLTPGEAPGGGLFMGAFILHLLLSMLYAVIIAPIVNSFRPVIAGMVGALVGVVLYFMSYAVTGMLTDPGTGGSEGQAFIIHVLFALFTAEAYKGFGPKTTPQAP